MFTAENAESAEMTERENLDQITESMIGAAIEVHRTLGPGLLESAYEACLTFGPTRPEGGTTETPARGLSGDQAGIVAAAWIFSSKKRSLSRLRPLIA